jgi:hypothetical protein
MSARIALVTMACALHAVCMLAGCGESKTPATQVIVAITSDLKPLTELSRVEISLSKRDGSDVVSLQDFAVVKAKPKPGQQVLPITFSVGKGNESSFLLTVSGYGPLGAGGAERKIVEQKAIATFQSHKTLLLRVFLGRVCLGNLCAGDQERVCYASDVGRMKAGECGAIPELGADDLDAVDPDKLPDLTKPPSTSSPADAGMRADAGPGEDAGALSDAGNEGGSRAPPDAGPSGPTPCVLGESTIGACTL